MNQETERRSWPKTVLQINLRLNKIEISHTLDTPPNISFILGLKARYIYGANYIKIITVN